MLVTTFMAADKYQKAANLMEELYDLVYFELDFGDDEDPLLSILTARQEIINDKIKQFYLRELKAFDKRLPIKQHQTDKLRQYAYIENKPKNII